MKLKLLFTLMLSGLSLQASISRMEALGGNLVAYNYFNDTQNILTNPAYINTNRDFVILEWGEDKDNSTRLPEGGIYKSIGALNYGIYLGNPENIDQRKEVSIVPKFLTQDNPFELAVAGDMGLEWGLALKYSSSHMQTNNAETTNVKKSQNAMSIKMGTINGPYEVYLHFNLFDTSQGGDDSHEKFKSKLGTLLGGNYNIENFIMHARIENGGYNYYESVDGNLAQESSFTSLNLGFGHTVFLTEDAKIYADLSLNNDNKTITSPNKPVKESHTFTAPITVGVEAYVKEWLTLRGHIQQNLYSNQTNYDYKGRSLPHSLIVAAGATVHLGNFKVDGLLGTIDPNDATARPGIISSNQFLAKVSTSYWF